jgi:polysaccharide deacetylase family protein (PEP-CTERM system associated)
MTLGIGRSPLSVDQPRIHDLTPEPQLVSSREPDSTPVKRGVVDCISVDLEDYFQVEAFASNIPRTRWPLYPARVRQNTERALELLARNACHATFFVLGWVAEREPDLIRAVASQGHELACHSHLHRPLYTITPSEFRRDVGRSRCAIEDAAGVKVVGFRAPTFSITEKTLWALDILAEEGFEYDSSIFPIRHDLYGIPDAPRWTHQKMSPSGQVLWEIPPATVRVGPVNLPFGGGGYLRLLPMSFTRWAIKTTHRRERQPVIVYFHPWELDPEQPRLSGSWRSRFRHYSGLTKTASRLQEILSQGTFQRLIDLVRSMQKAAPMVQAAAS